MTDLSQNRLPPKENCLFSGQLIKRNRPVSFRLNGRTYSGFEGDTVLSALLAGGVDTIGPRDDAPIALDAGCCPPIIPVSHKNEPARALPMDRTPALNGMELVTFATGARRGKVQHPFLDKVSRAISGAGKRNLDFDLSAGAVLPGPWIDGRPTRKHRVDVVVVGGGIAGMNAALAAADQKKQVALVECQPELGGEALFFGAEEGEARPEDIIAELSTRLREQKNVTIYTSALAFSLAGNTLKVHRVMVKGNEVRVEILGLAAGKIVLATGTLERLPVFAGNRLPGVMKARPAFHLASRYGVWRGGSAALCTASSAATRVALLAADAGVTIAKLADARANPNSRFFEFAKAYGILLVSATLATGATNTSGGQLSVTFGLTHGPEGQSEDALLVDRLVVCGGWQRNLTLWHRAGGRSRWDAKGQQLAALGGLENIVLAGSAAGIPGMTACAHHGESVIFDLFGIPERKGLTSALTTGFESGDGALPVARHSGNPGNSYLDGGYSFARPAQVLEPGFLQRVLPHRNVEDNSLVHEPKALGLNDVVAKVVLREIAAEFCGLMAEERCVESSRMAISATPEMPAAPTAFAASTRPPDYLRGRFGGREQVVELEADTEEVLEVGCLIYPDTAMRKPWQAIGVIFAATTEAGGSALAYMNISLPLKSRFVVVRNSTHVLFARLPINL